MNRLKNEYYTILDFPLVENEIVRLSLGIIGFLFVLRQSPFHICYIPSRFRQTLHTKCKQDLTQFLLDQGYIQLYQRPKNKNPDDEIFIISKSGKRYSYSDLKRGFKKIPYLYIPTVKLTKLRQIKLVNEKMILWIDEHLHLLNDQYFNHYNYSYKHIRFDLTPYERKVLTIEERNLIDSFGHPEIKEYHINDFGYDVNDWAGNHLNIFTDNKTYLLKYSNLVEPIEIGLKHSECLIIADQLMKTIGPNDYSVYYLKTRFSKQALFQHPFDYDLSKLIFEQQLFTALFGYFNVSSFAIMFPKAWNILYNIKAGRNNYLEFASNLKQPIFKTDIRLQIDSKHPAYERGQIYYKIISLVYYIRITQIMREIWNKLKKCDIIFIPLESSVVVSGLREEATTYIIETVLKKHIDKKIYFEISKIKL